MRKRFEDLTKQKKICSCCKKAMPRSQQGDLCPECEDRRLYSQVKEFILHNNVTEMEVAEHFNLPLQKVKRWIRDGYIEYRRGH